MSLNVAARDLLDTGLAETIGRGLARYELPPEALLLEINERVLTSEPAYAAAAVETLAALGVALSLDDFGTGYSSLVRLKRLPVSEVKIDSSFIRRLLLSADDEVIVQSIVDLVRGARHRLGGRGRRVRGGRGRAAGHGLRGRPGLALQQAAQRGVGHGVAGRARRGGRAVGAAADRDRHRRAARAVPRPARAARARPARLPFPRTPACPAPASPRRPRACRPYGGRRLKISARRCAVARLACMPITRDEVAHLAKLSRLALSEQELEHFAGQLDVIIAAVARVQEVAADGIPPMTHALPVTNVFRDDVIVPPLGAQAALDQAPASEQDRFRVPRILDGGLTMTAS